MFFDRRHDKRLSALKARCQDKRLIALADRRAALLAVSARQRHQLAHQCAAWQAALALPILASPAWLALIYPPARILTTAVWLRSMATQLLWRTLWQWWQHWRSVS